MQFKAQLRAANRAYGSKEKGNPVISFLVNFILPIFFLTKYSLFCDIIGIKGIIFPFKLGIAHNQLAANALVVSLLFPTVYFIYGCIKHGQASVVSIIGFIGVLVTGVVGLFELSSQWLAVKDAAIPLVLGVLLLFTLKMRPPLLVRMVCNDQIMDIKNVYAALERNGKEYEFRRLFTTTTIFFFVSFLISAVTHYILAIVVLVDPMPTNEQIAELMYLKYPYCVLPFAVCIVFCVWYLFRGLTKLTGMKFEDIFPAELGDAKSI